MPQHNIGQCGDQYIQAILNEHPQNCLDMFHMEVPAIRTICDVLRELYIMEPTECTSVEKS